jgi:hypothetical protein
VATPTDRIPNLDSTMERARFRLDHVRARLAEKAERFPAGRVTYAKAVAFYVGFMAVWTYGVAAQDRHIPQLIALVLLALPVVVHVVVGFAVGRIEVLWLAAFPPALALLGPGIAHSVLAVTLVILMIFPGAPLLALGVGARRFAEPLVVEDWF